MLVKPAGRHLLPRFAQVLLGGLSQWTVGLLATFLAVACIISADVGAFVVGKAVGRTPLSEISPKKTVEGAAGGLLCR
jgi:phosphatidate cytidylyltransferase